MRNTMHRSPPSAQPPFGTSPCIALRTHASGIFRQPKVIGMSVPKIYINGKFFDKPDAKISVYDHGLLYGDGVFEGIRIYGGKVFRSRSTSTGSSKAPSAIQLEIPLSHDADGRRRSTPPSRPTTRRTATSARSSRAAPAPRPRSRASRSDPQVIIIVDDISLYPAELYENGMEIVTVATIRNHPNAAEPAHQVAQLSQQHPGQDRRPARPAASKR